MPQAWIHNVEYNDIVYMHSISVIKRHGCYLFHPTMYCSYYLRVATIQGQCSLNSAQIGCKKMALENVRMIIKLTVRAGANFKLCYKPLLCYKAVNVLPVHFLAFFNITLQVAHPLCFKLS